MSSPALFLALSLVLAAPAVTVEKTLDTHGWGKPTRDAALDRVATEMARRLSGVTEGAVNVSGGAQLRFLLAQQNVNDVHVFPLTVRHRSSADLADTLPTLLGRLERHLPPTHFGLGTTGMGGILTTTILLVHRGLSFERPLPMAAEPGTMMNLSGALRRGYFQPRVLIAPPDNRPVRDRPAWSERRRAEVTLYFDAGPGVYGVEVVADSQYGPVVLNNHRVYVGVPPPQAPMARLRSPEPVHDPFLAATQLAKLINLKRTQNGRTGLAWHDELAKLARGHAVEMARRNALAHGSPSSGTLLMRLRERGIAVHLVAENLAEAANPTAALHAFMDSPGHKRNLMLEPLTHIGVGVQGRYFAVALVQRAQDR